MRMFSIWISIVLFIGIFLSGCIDTGNNDKYFYEYKIVVKVENDNTYYLLLPIIEQYHDEDKSIVLSDLKFQEGNGSYIVERVEGRYINVSSNENITLNCRGKTSEFTYNPTSLEIKKTDAPSGINNSFPCYVNCNNNNINITLIWYSSEPYSLIDQTYYGTYQQNGWHILNVTYGKQYVV